MDRCDGCRFWFQIGTNGECRRNPPQQMITIHHQLKDTSIKWSFPFTHNDSFCGEHKIIQ